jgi:hypothetical protein
VPAQVPARKARAGTRTQNGRHSTRIAYDNTRERLHNFRLPDLDRGLGLFFGK